MFGSKKGKQQRLERMINLLQEHPAGVSPSEMARHLGVPRSTVHRDLIALEKRQVLLAEDSRGRISLFKRLFGQE